jgi:hypothetical protein
VDFSLVVFENLTASKASELYQRQLTKGKFWGFNDLQLLITASTLVALLFTLILDAFAAKHSLAVFVVALNWLP